MNTEEFELEIGQPTSYELDPSKIKTLEDLILILTTIGFQFNQQFVDNKPEMFPFIKEVNYERTN